MLFISGFMLPAEKAIETDSRKLNALRKEIIELKKELVETGERKDSVLNKLNELKLLEKLKKKELEQYELETFTLNISIQTRTEKIHSLEAEIVRQKKYLSERLVEIYKLGELNYLRAVLSMENPGEILRSYKYLSMMARKNSETMVSFRENAANLSRENVLLGVQLEEQQKLLRHAFLKKSEIEDSRKKTEKMLKTIESDEVIRQTALEELERAAQALENLISGFSAKKPSENKLHVSIKKLKGLLNWPLKGRVLSAFGKVKHPQFKTITLHNGIDIEAETGITVKAAYNGTVVFSDWFEGYGKTVIIDHNEDYFSVYAHLSEFSVSSGEFVEKGQKIAESGETGSLKGPFLYFEIRKGTEALDPIEWLEK